ncbi:MAG: hypothetical protein IPF92_11940 [Myxococcales bacterium]|nr:hypothetical protein [Myxococcales bacterium]MBL0198211.1 hypothetical protein [Myxococcales bacterium]HQY62280.1 hypothetical protein [Polyangiaceae bacterium]
MPLLLAPLVAILIGLVLTYYGRAELSLADRTPLGTRSFRVALAFAVLVYAPVLGYFAAFHGDWAYLYLGPQARLPSAVDLALVLLAAALIPATLAIAARSVAEQRSGLLLRAGGATLAVTLLLCALASKRLLVSASYVQFRGGFGGVPLGQSPLGRGVLLSWVALGAAAAWARASLRDAR